MGANGRIAALEVLRARGRKAALTRRRRDRAYDAIVIGGGHNGLVTAAYLGKAGLRTLVLERRETLGGAAGTSELAPGARVPTLAHTVGRLRPSVVRDLDLKRHGLSLVGPDVRVFAPGPDGDAVVLWGDVARTAEGLRATVCGRRRALRGVRPAGPGAVGLPRASSPGRRRRTSHRPGSATRWPGSASGARSVASAGTTAGPSPASCRWRSPTSWPNRSRATRVQAAHRLARESSTPRWGRGRPARPRSCSPIRPATTAERPARRSTHAAARARSWRRSSGAARAAGVEIRTGAEVVAITSRDGRATGVALASGEELTRPGRGRRHRPEAGPHPARRPGRRRSEPAAGGRATSGRRARSPRSTSPSPACRAFTAAGDETRLVRGRILVAPGIDAMERAHDAAKFGRLPDAPIMEATIPSLADPSLVDGAAPGTHVMSVIVQCRAVRLARAELGRAARGARRPGRPDARRLCARVWPDWSRLARC